MRFILVFLLLYIYTSQLTAQQIWVLANIDIVENEATDFIKDSLTTTHDDILILHGNALAGQQKAILTKVRTLKKHFKKVYLIPGDKDWDYYKSKELKKLGDYLDQEIGGDIIVPENGCGNLEVKEIGKNLALVFLDSEWYFQNWDEDKHINKGCAVQSREGYWDHVAGKLGKLKANQILLFTRYPLKRYDTANGRNRISDHIFPLADIIPGFYIPLPIVGTFINDTRTYFQANSSANSPLYQEYVTQLENIATKHDALTIITSDSKLTTVEQLGHTYMININSQNHISHNATVPLEHISNEPSILKIDVKGSVITSTILDFEGIIEHVNILSSELPLRKAASNKYEEDISGNITRPIRKEADYTRLNPLIFGSLNADRYLKEITVPQLDLNTKHGGLTPLRLGGGLQTRSLRFQDSLGNTYVARSLKKRAKRALPNGLNYKPFVKTIEHYFMASEPVALLASEVMDSAIQVLHITPEIYHLPKQNKLGIYNDQIGGELVSFRERADGNWSQKESYGNSKNIISSTSMIKKMEKNKAKVDAKMYLRARLLDLIQGDWDRHIDQWRWAEDTIAGDKLNTYSPIARDKDQVFSNYDGFLMKLVRPYDHNVLQLRKFDHKLSQADIRWMYWMSSLLDNTLLHNLTAEQWNEQTKFVKQNLTTEILQTAVNKLPLSYGEDRADILDKLKSRVNDIDNTSKIFRSELLEHGVVKCSSENDSIYINLKKKSIHIKVIADHDEKNKNIKFDGIFNSESTDRIWIYGLEGKDVFVVNGESSNIDLTIIGGYGKDTYLSKIKHPSVTIVDDQNRNEVKQQTKEDYREVQHKSIHDFTRFDLIPQHRFFMPMSGYDTDNGVLIGGGYTWINRGFKNITTHKLSASYLTQRQSSLLEYTLNFHDELDRSGRYFMGRWSGPKRQIRYYGGNNSTKLGNLKYHNVFVSDILAEYGWSKSLNDIITIKSGIYGWSAEVEDDENTFLTREAEIDKDIFERQYFSGLKLNLTWSNFNDPLRITKGARMAFKSDYRYNYTRDKSNFLFSFEYDYYKDLLDNQRIIFSTKVRADHIIGSFFIYEGLQLGGNELLRGFGIGRFTGRTRIAQNSNVHIKLIDQLFDKLFPSSIGVTASFDHGRVWNKNEDSSQWHISYGGGLWISPLDKLVLSAGYHRSTDDEQFRLLFNWQF